MDRARIHLRLYRLLTHLHAPWFRRHHGRESLRLFTDWVAAAPTPEEARTRARAGVIDALRTLPMSWFRGGAGIAEGVWGERGLALGLLAQGFRSVARLLRKEPLQAVVVIGTLVLALGANTVLFSVARALLIRDLPYREAERIVHVQGSAAKVSMEGGWQLDPEFAQAQGIREAALYLPNGWANLTGAGEASRVSLAQVSPEFFSVLGVELVLGPGFTGGPEGVPVAVLSHSLWVRAFGSDAAILSRTLILNGQSYDIVGVAPPEVAYPRGTEAWLSLPTVHEFYGNAVGPGVVARLEPGAGITDVEAVLEDRYLPRIQAAAEAGYAVPPIRLVSLRERLVEDVTRPLFILLGAAALILILGCLNLAGVWVSRILERGGELRMRRALGASRLALFWQLLAETLALALLGGGIALGLAAAGGGLLRARLPADVPGVFEIGLDPLTVVFALSLTLLAGLGFGGLAALKGAGAGGTIRARGASAGRESKRIQMVLAAAQGTLALVLLTGAILTARSFQELTSEALGFDPEGALSLRVRLPRVGEGGALDPVRYAQELLDRVTELPAVETAGITNSPLLSFELGGALRVRIPGGPEEEAEGAVSALATPEYFRAAGIRFIQGRSFEDTPSLGSNGVVLDAELARRFFGLEEATGRVVELQLYRSGWEWVPHPVVGVVEGVRARGVRNEAFPTFYRSFWSLPTRNIGLMVRTRGDPAGQLEAIRAAALGVDPTVVPFDVRTMVEASRRVVASDRALALVSSGFSLVALLLTGLGLYGLVARQIALRRKELGIRLALGARPESLVGSMAGHGLFIGGIALLLGVPSTLLAVRFLRAHLFQVEATDPASMAGAALGVLTLSFLAAWIPARKAARVDPRESLAEE